MALKRMDNVLIVVEDLEAAKAFFVELGMELEGQTLVEGPSVDVQPSGVSLSLRSLGHIPAHQNYENKNTINHRSS